MILIRSPQNSIGNDLGFCISISLGDTAWLRLSHVGHMGKRVGGCLEC